MLKNFREASTYEVWLLSLGLILKLEPKFFARPFSHLQTFASFLQIAALFQLCDLR